MDEELLPPRPLRPATHVWQDWRGAQLTSISGGVTAAVTVQIEAHRRRVMTGPLSSLPSDAQTIGTPLAIQVSGAGADTYAILSIVGSSFHPFDAPRDQVAAVARGEFHPGIIPAAITGQSTVIDWNAQDTRNAAAFDRAVNRAPNTRVPNPLGGKA